MPLRLLMVVCALWFVGCGGAIEDQAKSSGGSQATQLAALQQKQDGLAPTSSTPKDSVLPAPADTPSADRKVIHHATMKISVIDFGESASLVETLTSQHGGFIASSQFGGYSGSTRRGHWTLRVPVAQYSKLVNALSKVGELKEQRETSEEVTAEFIDLEARVRNKQQEEQRLLDHLDQTTKGLSEILIIEKELSRVRSEVERIQGRLKLLADQTSLSTIDLTLTEIETFVPAESPTFVTRWQRTWHNSIERLVGFVQVIVLIATAMFPWLLTLALLLLAPLTAKVLRRQSMDLASE